MQFEDEKAIQVYFQKRVETLGDALVRPRKRRAIDDDPEGEEDRFADEIIEKEMQKNGGIDEEEGEDYNGDEDEEHDEEYQDEEDEEDQDEEDQDDMSDDIYDEAEEEKLMYEAMPTKRDRTHPTIPPNKRIKA